MKAQEGLTLVEIMVAMAILGMILLFVTSWQTQTLDLTTKTNSLAEQLTEMNDLSGYLGDRVRSASQVRLAGFTVNAASAVNAGNCDTTTPCLAVLALEEDADPSTTPPTITRRWLRLVYRVEPRSTWVSADKVADTWADDAANNIVVVREYRDSCTETSTGTCSGSLTLTVANFKASFLASAFSSMNPALVADHLTSVDQGATAITPFALADTTRPVGPSNPVTLTFQTKRTVRGTAAFMPADSPYTLTVQPRNVP